MNTSVTYHLSEPQAAAILAALRKLSPGAVAELLPETRSELSSAYHRLRGALTRSSQGDPNCYLR